jgi:rhomboid protease GluP
VLRSTAPQRQPRPRTPAAFALLGAIAVIYLVSLVLSGIAFQPSMAALVLMGAKVNDLIAGGEYWRLLTATFLHANLIHIFFNGYALYALGPEAERIYGTRRFLALYFLAGLAGSLASYLMSPAVSVGASGAIFGLIGGLGVFYYLNRATLGDFGKAQVQNMVTIAMINLFIGFAAQGTIDNWGHMGGLAGGALAGLALAPRLQIDTRLYPPVLRREHPALGWAGAAALLLVIAAMALLLPPA